uniref:Uncharacterized protein n=1 Tax=Setaria italica TaxID=4555 RepID=K3Y0R2_SETIT
MYMISAHKSNVGAQQIGPFKHSNVYNISKVLNKDWSQHRLSKSIQIHHLTCTSCQLHASKVK